MSEERKAELGVEEVIFETVLLECIMLKPKFGPFSRVGGDDQVIDNVNLP